LAYNRTVSERGFFAVTHTFLRGRIKLLDYLVFFTVAAVSAGSAVLVYGGGPADTDRLLISVSGPDGDWLYPVNAVGTVRVAGPLGDTVVEIGGGRARIVSSPCRNQLCVAAPPVYRHGQWIACLPNQVMARVDGSSATPDGTANAVDGVSW
jgi:hypothetical protein